ncbi:Pm3-like protein [Hordeum vulgare]|nr:Pm3-like protein [Hordeum vulgare]
MLQIPSLKMRMLWIRYMVDIFDPSTARFKVQDLVGEVSLRVVDVECILILDNEGLSAADILIEEDIIKNKSAADNFLRKVVAKKGKHLRQWPKGNLALLQYLYWEKVQPLEATRRDRFDYDNGCGRENVKKLLEKLNKEDVMYKPAAAVPSCNNDGDDEVDSFENEVLADELIPKLIDAAVTFVDIACRSEKNKGKRVYYNGSINSVSSEVLWPVLEHRWVSDAVIDSYQAHLALRVGHDRHLCPAWRSRYLVAQTLA